MDIMFYEVFEEEEKALKEHLPENLKASFTPNTIQQSKDNDPPANLISIRTQSHIPEGWANEINGIFTRSAGYDHVLKYCEEVGREIPSGYLENYCSRAVAEQAILLMLSLLRKLNQQIKQFEKFNRDGLTGQDCKGKNLLVVGVGFIGSEIADIANGLGIEVKGVDIEEKRSDIKYASLKEGISWANIIICSAALTSQTNEMLNYEILKNAKKNSVFVNVARGEISPIKDLQRLMDEGILSGVALDVFPNEGSFAQLLREGGEASPEAQAIIDLKQKPNVIFSPHNAFNTQESVELKAKLSVDSLKSFLKTGSFIHSVKFK